MPGPSPLYLSKNVIKLSCQSCLVLEIKILASLQVILNFVFYFSKKMAMGNETFYGDGLILKIKKTGPTLKAEDLNV